MNSYSERQVRVYIGKIYTVLKVLKQFSKYSNNVSLSPSMCSRKIGKMLCIHLKTCLLFRFYHIQLSRRLFIKIFKGIFSCPLEMWTKGYLITLTFLPLSLFYIWSVLWFMYWSFMEHINCYRARNTLWKIHFTIFAGKKSEPLSYYLPRDFLFAVITVLYLNSIYLFIDYLYLLLICFLYCSPTSILKYAQLHCTNVYYTSETSTQTSQPRRR